MTRCRHRYSDTVTTGTQQKHPWSIGTWHLEHPQLDAACTAPSTHRRILPQQRQAAQQPRCAPRRRGQHCQSTLEGIYLALNCCTGIDVRAIVRHIGKSNRSDTVQQRSAVVLLVFCTVSVVCSINLAFTLVITPLFPTTRYAMIFVRYCTTGSYR